MKEKKKYYRTTTSETLIDREITVQRILDVVQAVCGYDISEKHRDSFLAYNRAIFYKLCVKYLGKFTGYLSTLGRLTNVTHASVIHALSNIEEPSVRILTDPNYYKCDMILQMIFKQDFNFEDMMVKSRNISDHKSDIMNAVERLVSEYETKIEFYKHDFFNEFPAVYELFTTCNREQLKRFEETRVIPYMNTLPKTKSNG